MDFPYILEAKRKGKQEYRRFVGKFDSTAKRFETIDREDRSRWFNEHDVSRQPNRVRNFAGFDIFSDNHSARSGQAINRQDFESLPEDGSWEKLASPHASPRSIDFIVPARRCIWRGRLACTPFTFPSAHRVNESSLIPFAGLCSIVSLDFHPEFTIFRFSRRKGNRFY